FFLAFLPQFADPERGSMAAQLVLLGLVFILATIIVFGSVSLLAGRIGQRLAASPRAVRILNRAAGTLFVLLAARLLIDTR
ncbi:MAG: LysE family transporter, partial [Gammaproteobacteria bacterium]|nr:LysE family transporter [Gammaproteobacteria bacterium]